MNTLKQTQGKQQEVFSDRRRYKRVAILATFCIFVTDGHEKPNAEKTPFVSAGLYDISLGGAQFSCESMTACSPFCDNEQKIEKNSTIWLIANRPSDEMSSCGSCSCSEPTDEKAKINVLGDEPIEAKVMWVNKDRFGCMFISPADGFTKALEKIIDDIVSESGIEL